ncbi:MAG: cytochrome c [Aureliella sp.]
MLRRTLAILFATSFSPIVWAAAGEAALANEPEAHRPAAACDTSEPIDLEKVDLWLESLSPAARRGYRHLTESAYLPADLDDEVFEALIAHAGHAPPTLPAKSAARSGLSAKRAAAFLKYGLTERPGEPAGLPLQYVVEPSADGSPRWVMNCFACHGGSVYGRTLPGAPNNLYQLQSLTEDVRRAKLQQSKRLTHMDLGSMAIPLGTSVGTTNAVMFGVALMNYRDAELNVQPAHAPPRMVHHDMDPPAWWLFHRTRRLYVDGFAEKGVRGLMQFMLVRENGPEQFRAWESDFEDVYAFIESLRPPKYPHAIDGPLAERGRLAFNAHCARCHGTTAAVQDGTPDFYPEKLVSIDELGTDRVRLDSLTAENRRHYGASWFGYFGKQETWDEPDGYMAPPLDGVWASAPYFHNGSVPTLWHVLHPEERPTVWRRTHLELDTARVGLKVAALEDIPAGTTVRGRRDYFDTRQFGKSRHGHDFPNELTEDQRAAVLEYLKTL